jgi:saccharopine dehydrogenase-like NADP-dependent oxidoreductase
VGGSLYNSSHRVAATVKRVSSGSRAPARVAVLGAAGTIAPAIVHDLGESAEVAEMVLLDLDGDRAAAVAERHGAGKATARAADARAGLAGELAGADVLVNTASYRINLDAMRACLEAGCSYLDLGGLYWLTRHQLKLADEFEHAGLLALLGVGSSPGKTNLMAQRALRELDGSAPDSIDIYAAGRDPRAAGQFSPPYALQTLLDELTLAPVVLREGRPVEIEPLTRGGAIDFGDPIGVAETIFTLHSELATFGESFGTRESSFRLSLNPTLLERLQQLVGSSPEQVAAAARDAVPPSDATTSVHLVVVKSGDRTVFVRALSPPHFGIGGSIVSTAAPAAAAVRLLARGELSATGAMPPERAVDPEAMFAELETRGCRFSVEVS